DGTPWGDEATPAFAAAVESELERKLATSILRDGVRLVRRRVARGETLVEQGKPGDDLFVLLDGVFDVEVDGEVVAQVGSGAILGERAVVGDGLRTATLRAVRSSRVAVIGSEAIEKTLDILVVERQRLREQHSAAEPLEANRRAILYWQRELAEARRSTSASA